MGARSGDALGHQPALQVLDEVAVLGVDLRERAQLPAAREPRDEVLVREHLLKEYDRLVRYRIKLDKP